MQCGSPPGTGISAAHSKGTLLHPRSRAAWAGKAASRSGVMVKMALAMSSTVKRLASCKLTSSSLVASRISAAPLAAAVVAPRIPRSCNGKKHPLRSVRALTIGLYHSLDGICNISHQLPPGHGRRGYTATGTGRAYYLHLRRQMSASNTSPGMPSSSGRTKGAHSSGRNSWRSSG